MSGLMKENGKEKDGVLYIMDCRSGRNDDETLPIG
jgi:hypothetical protein